MLVDFNDTKPLIIITVQDTLDAGGFSSSRISKVLLAAMTAGTATAMRTARIATTVSSSVMEKPLLLRFICSRPLYITYKESIVFYHISRLMANNSPIFFYFSLNIFRNGIFPLYFEKIPRENPVFYKIFILELETGLDLQKEYVYDRFTIKGGFSCIMRVFSDICGKGTWNGI